MTKRVELTAILWGLLVANNWLLASGQIENWVKVSGIVLGFLIVTWWISTQLDWHQNNSRVMLTVGINLLVGWIILLPLGGLGITSYLISLVVLPQWLLRLMYLHRIVIVPILVVFYGALILLWWQLIRKKMLQLAHPKDDNNLVTIQLGRNVSRLILTSVVGLILMYVCSTKLADINDGLAGFVLLFLGTLLLACWLSMLTMIYFKLPLDSKSHLMIDIGLMLVGILLVLGWTSKLNYVDNLTTPTIISHRGVDGSNGVQNTMQSLSKTVTAHPAVIEMDVQATRDNSFVCFHDANLDHLAHQRTTVAKLKVSQLRHTKLSENGSTTLMTTFNQYLRFSIQHHQSLIVEIKPQSISPEKVAHLFDSKYAAQLIQQKTKIHSVDDNIIKELYHEDPKLSLGLIRPFVVSRLTNRNVNFYSLDYRTVNQQIVNQLHQRHQKVYVWTVNNPDVANRMVQLGVDGIITNRISLIRARMGSHNQVVTRVKNILWQLI